MIVGFLSDITGTIANLANLFQASPRYPQQQRADTHNPISVTINFVTLTPSPVLTSTPLPNCEDEFTLTFASDPVFEETISIGWLVSRASGIYAIFDLELTNNTPIEIHFDFMLEGLVNEMDVKFPLLSSVTGGYNYEYADRGYKDVPGTSLLPTIPTKTLLIFDVNPTGKNWNLILNSYRGFGDMFCSLKIPLKDLP